jgi:hypothetical protein
MMRQVRVGKDMIHAGGAAEDDLEVGEGGDAAALRLPNKNVNDIVRVDRWVIPPMDVEVGAQFREGGAPFGKRGFAA